MRCMTFYDRLGVIYNYSAEVFPLFRILSLTSSCIVVLFIDALLYYYTNINDGKVMISYRIFFNFQFCSPGSCKSILSERSCVDRLSSPFSASQCYWDVQSNICYFSEHNPNTSNILYMFLFCSMSSIPVIIFIEHLCLRIFPVSIISNETTIHVDSETGSNNHIE